MKRYTLVIAAILLSALSLYADQEKHQVRYQFTVTQIALDIQQAQLAEETIPQDENSSD